MKHKVVSAPLVRINCNREEEKDDTIELLLELWDGTIVSVSNRNAVKRWSKGGVLLNTIKKADDDDEVEATSVVQTDRETIVLARYNELIWCNTHEEESHPHVIAFTTRLSALLAVTWQSKAVLICGMKDGLIQCLDATNRDCSEVIDEFNEKKAPRETSSSENSHRADEYIKSFSALLLCKLNDDEGLFASHFYRGIVRLWKIGSGLFRTIHTCYFRSPSDIFLSQKDTITLVFYDLACFTLKTWNKEGECLDCSTCNDVDWMEVLFRFNSKVYAIAYSSEEGHHTTIKGRTVNGQELLFSLESDNPLGSGKVEPMRDGSIAIGREGNIEIWRPCDDSLTELCCRELMKHCTLDQLRDMGLLPDELLECCEWVSNVFSTE